MSDSGFHPPDLDGPLNVEQHYAALGEEHQIKGLFILDLQSHLPSDHELNEERFYPFSDYSTRALMDLLVEVAQHRYPDSPLREALFALGEDAARVFRRSLPGRVALGAVESIRGVIEQVPMVYESVVAGSPCSVAVDENQAIVSFDSVPTFADSYLVGALIGLFEEMPERPQFKVRSRGIDAVDVRLTW